MASPNGKSERVIGARAIQHGLEQLSKHKRTTFLEAEFPHLSKHIRKFVGGKATYTQAAIKKLLGGEWESGCADLVAIGLLRKRQSKNGAGPTFEFPHLYRKGLELTQGTAV